MRASLAFVMVALAGFFAPCPTRAQDAVVNPPREVGPRVGFAQEISRDTLDCPGCTTYEPDTQAEPHIAVNPDDANNLVAVVLTGVSSDICCLDKSWSASFDGGRTWGVRGNAPGVTGLPQTVDPVVAFDRKHQVVYLQSLAFIASPGGVAVSVNISGDQGRTFGPSVIIDRGSSDATGNGSFDKDWIAVDNAPGSRHYGRAYAVWDRIAGGGLTADLMLSSSDDGGRSWLAPVTVVSGKSSELAALPLPLPNGDLVIVYTEFDLQFPLAFGSAYLAIRSTDGGATFGKPALIDVATPLEEFPALGLRAPTFLTAAVDGDGTIYVAFQDARFSGVTNDILMTASTDGVLWSPPANVTPFEASLDHITPAIAAANGIVHLTYRTHAPGSVAVGPRVDAVYRALRRTTTGLIIDFATVTGPLTLYAPSDASVAAVNPFIPIKWFGDYAGIAASPRAAHPVWCQAMRFPEVSPTDPNPHQRTFSARIGF